MRQRIVPLALFAIAFASLTYAITQITGAYAWVEHTSDVRMIIGRAIGDGCTALSSDVAELGRLTSDNDVQQRRIPVLEREVGETCRGDGEARRMLVAELAAADAEERRLLVERRAHLAKVATAAFATFAIAMALAFGVATRASLGRERLLASLKQSEERFRLLAESATDLIRVHEPSGKATYVTPSCLQLLGYTQEEMLAMGPNVELVHPEDREQIRAYLDAVAVDPNVPPLRHRLRLKSGELRWFETHTHPVHEGGKLVRFYTSSRDIHERVAAEEKLEAIAVTDELTGLHNRRGFTMLAGNEHRLAVRQGRGLLLVYADLDGLKGINDDLGHEHGDSAIRDFAEVLRATFRASDITARLGGDEFAVLAFDVEEQSESTVAERIRSALDAFNRESSRAYRLAASIGCARLAPNTSRSLDELVAEADRRMYEAKRARRAAAS